MTITGKAQKFLMREEMARRLTQQRGHVHPSAGNK
jgi:hypothetical protein